MSVIDLLTEKLGISQQQAEGGLGLLLKLAKDKLSSDMVDKVVQFIPDADKLIDAAPDTSGGVMGTIGGLVGGLGGKAKDMGALANLSQGFDKLGIGKEKLGQFGSTVTSYLQEQGGDSASEALKGLLQ